MGGLRAAMSAALFVCASAAGPAFSDEFRLYPRVGQCEYSSKPQSNERRTKCTAEAYVVNATTSEVFFCRGETEGDQYVAPSVAESAPEEIVCQSLGRVFPRNGAFDFAHVDDLAKVERTFNRMEGWFTWKNGFWVHSRTAPELKFCARRLAEAGPDYRMRCSKNAEWRK